MEIKNHIIFDEDDAPKLAKYLSENGIEYKDSECFFVLDISEQSPHWPTIKKKLKKDISYISETTFTIDELNSAEWLQVRSAWRFDYPQPEDHYGYESITYTKEHLCDECKNGLIQQAPFRFKKEPKWGKRNFMMTNWVYDEFFVSPRAKKILENENIPNISFMPVLNKKGNVVFEETYQLIIESLLPLGLISKESCIQAKYHCSKCNRVKYHTNGRGQYVFPRAIFENMPPIIKTSDCFGWGAESHRLIIVNQEIFQLLRRNGLDSSLVFEPIKLV